VSCASVKYFDISVEGSGGVKLGAAAEEAAVDAAGVDDELKRFVRDENQPPEEELAGVEVVGVEEAGVEGVWPKKSRFIHRVLLPSFSHEGSFASSPENSGVDKGFTFVRNEAERGDRYEFGETENPCQAFQDRPGTVSFPGVSLAA
jgi:hypothetical protein